MRTVDSSQCAKCAGGHSQLLVCSEPPRIRFKPDSNAKDHHNSGPQQHRQKTLSASQSTPSLRAGIRHWWKGYQPQNIPARGIRPTKPASERTPASTADVAERVHRPRRKSCRKHSVIEGLCQCLCRLWHSLNARYLCMVRDQDLGWVAGVGLSEAKEAPGFQAGALQPRPPQNTALTQRPSGI